MRRRPSSSCSHPAPSARPTAVRAVARRAVALLAVVQAVAFLTGCNPEDSPRERAAAVTGRGDCRVGLIGDSLLVGARDTGRITERFASVGCTVTAVDAKVSRFTVEGATIAEAWAAFGVMPDILVVGLGTNDCSRDAVLPAVRRTLAAAGPDRPVVWVNSWRPGCDGAINQTLHDVQRELDVRADGGNLWV